MMGAPARTALLDAIVAETRAKPFGDWYLGHCPAHDDKRRSLSFKEGDRKPVMFTCHAGCTPEAIEDALRTRGVQWPEDLDDDIEATYDYVDANGRLLYQVVRRRGKRFAQRRPDGAGGWVGNIRGVERVLYNLPAVMKAVSAGETIFIPEGEKDADTLGKHALIATTNSGGAAAKWDNSYSQYVRGAKVVILPDNDAPGRKHAEKVRKALTGIAASVEVVNLPGLPEKGDVSDWLKAGHTRDELLALVAEAAAVDSTAATPESDTPRRKDWFWLNATTPSLGSDYLIKGVLGKGNVACIYGEPGSGKTFFTIDLAAHVACGIPWHGKRVKPGLVVYVAAEAGGSIQRRFHAWRIENQRGEDAIPLAVVPRAYNLLDDDAVAQLIEDLTGIATEASMSIALVVFDTLSRSIPGGDENSAKDMTKALGVADRIRDEFGAATIFDHHPGKDVTRGSRGHSSLKGGVDVEILIADHTATLEKVRDGATGEKFVFDLRVVKLGNDADGDEMTTCVAVATNAIPASAKKALRLSGVAKTGLTALYEALTDHGEVMPGSTTIPKGVKAVTIEQWRARFKTRYGSEQGGKERVAFMRAKEALMKAEAIQVSDPYVWSTSR